MTSNTDRVVDKEQAWDEAHFTNDLAGIILSSDSTAKAVILAQELAEQTKQVAYIAYKEAMGEAVRLAKQAQEEGVDLNQVANADVVFH